MPRRNSNAQKPQRAVKGVTTKELQLVEPTRISVPSIHLEPRTENQDRLLRAIAGSAQLVIALGAAGTGKSWAAVNGGLNYLSDMRSRHSKLVFSRAAVPTGRSIGFFPGTAEEKLEPWLQPMISEFKSRAGGGVYSSWLHSGKLELLPLETIRGRSFEDSVVIVDEIQSCTKEEIISIVTRVGSGSKLILTGDLAQSDIREPGLLYLLEVIARDSLPIPFILFEVEDVVRSDIVGQLVKSFQKDSKDLYENYRYYAEKAN